MSLNRVWGQFEKYEEFLGNIQKTIHLVEPLGKDTLLYFETENERELIAIVDSNSSYRAGDSVHLDLIPEHIFLFGSDGKRILD